MNLKRKSDWRGWKVARAIINLDSFSCTWLSTRLNEHGPRADRKGLKQVWHQLCASQEKTKPLVKGTAPGPLFYQTKWLLSANFPLGPKGDLASALASLIWTNMWLSPHLHNSLNGNEGASFVRPRQKEEREGETDWCHSAELHLHTPQRCDISSLILNTFNYSRGSRLRAAIIHQGFTKDV